MKTTTMKRILATVSALAMSAVIAAPAMSASAAPMLTIESQNENVSIKNKNFSVYQIAQITEIAENVYEYKINADYKGYLLSLVDGDDSLSDMELTEKLTEVFENYEEDDNRKLADKLAELSKTAYRTITIDGEGNGNSVDLDQKGYYLVVETTEMNGSTNSAKSAYLLKTINDETNPIYIKADKPSIDKKVKSNGQWIEANQAGVGDVVEYQITADIPNMEEYNKYQYIITDTLSDGLTLDKTSINITVGGEECSHYDLDTETDGKFVITWSNLKECLDDFTWKEGTSKVVVTYSAKLNEKAVMGVAGNPNEVQLKYSNDPENSSKGIGDPTGETPKEYTRTYVTELTIHKQDSKGNTLTGAKFTIKGDNVNYYVSIEKGKVIITSDKSGTIAPETGVEGEVDESGNLVFKGLPEGTYTITETKAPDGGYNILKDSFDVEITYTAPENSNSMGDGTSEKDKCGWKYKVDGIENNNDLGTDTEGTFNVTNRKGGLFPSTGGIGVTIFYTVGIAMLMGAGVLVIVKRKAAER